MAKKVDPNQINLFADFGMEIIQPPKPKPKPIQQIMHTDTSVRKSEDEMILWFAKQCKQSIAFLDCVLKGLLPGDYHGTKLWIRRWKGLWTNELIEDADYWINLEYKVWEQKEVVYIIKI